MKKIISILIILLITYSNTYAICNITFDENEFNHNTQEKVELNKSRKVLLDFFKKNNYNDLLDRISKFNYAYASHCGTSKNYDFHIYNFGKTINWFSKSVIVKDWEIIDIFNNNWFSIQPYISNNWKHVIYYIQSEDWYSQKSIKWLYIDNIKIIWLDELHKNYIEKWYNHVDSFIREKGLKYLFWNYYFPLEYNIHKPNKTNYKYNLSESLISRVDTIIKKIDSKYYNSLLKQLDRINEYYLDLWEEISLKDYKKQVLYYYIYTEIRIKELKEYWTLRM